MLMQVHPSRTAPLCKDCKHFIQGKNSNWELCGHPVTPTSLIDGKPIVSASCMRGGDSGALRILQVTPCGSAGDFFEPLVQRLNDADGMVLGKQGHVGGGGGGQVSAEQFGVALCETVAQPLVNVSDGDIKPPLDEVGRVQFKLPHEPLPRGDESADGTASAIGLES